MIFENSANKSNVEINWEGNDGEEEEDRYSAVQRKLIYNLSIEMWNRATRRVRSMLRTFDKNQQNVVDGTQLSQFHWKIRTKSEEKKIQTKSFCFIEVSISSGFFRPLDHLVTLFNTQKGNHMNLVVKHFIKCSSSFRVA